jgi:hypothetical protein
MLHIEVSGDGGSTWTKIYSKSAQELFNMYGSNTFTNVSVPIPVSFMTANFRYRFRTTQATGCNYDNIIHIDDCKIITHPCTTPATNILSLGNLVWNDRNLNGVRDTDEPGVANATVKLYKDDNNDNMADGAAIRTTTTNSNGNYLFSSLEPGNYIVGVIIPSGLVRGPQSDIDPDNNVDNDNNGVMLIGNNSAGGEVRSKAITLSAGNEPINDGDGNNSNLTLDIALCQATTTPPPPPSDCPTTGTTTGGHKVVYTGVSYSGTGQVL